MRGRGDRADVAARVAAASTEAWFPLAYLSAPGDEDDDTKWRLEMDYAIGPALARLSAPTLLINGDRDRWVPVQESQRVWRDLFGARHPGRLTTVRLPSCGHYPTEGRGEDGEEDAPISSDYEAIVLDWLSRESANKTHHDDEKRGMYSRIDPSEWHRTVPGGAHRGRESQARGQEEGSPGQEEGSGQEEGQVAPRRAWPGTSESPRTVPGGAHLSHHEKPAAKPAKKAAPAKKKAAPAKKKAK